MKKTISKNSLNSSLKKKSQIPLDIKIIELLKFCAKTHRPYEKAKNFIKIELGQLISDKEFNKICMKFMGINSQNLYQMFQDHEEIIFAKDMKMEREEVKNHPLTKAFVDRVMIPDNREISLDFSQDKTFKGFLDNLKENLK